VLNIFKSNHFINELYNYLNLNRFEDEIYIKKSNQSSINDYQKSIFYSFTYFLYTNINSAKEDIQAKLFSHYFLHHISTINTKTNTSLNYKDMTEGYIKGKDFKVKESYKIDDTTKNVNFKILLNGKIKINLDGKSIKTLRKKAYKEIFFYILDNQENKQNEKLALKEIIYDIHIGN